MDIEVKIRGLMVDPSTNMPIIVLKVLEGDIVVPIWVGIYEANAIAIEIEKATVGRPMTHDLIKNLIQGLNGRIEKIVIKELKDDTFYAVIWIDQQGTRVAVDARPSDAIALALRADCPIFVSEQVAESARIAGMGPEGGSSEDVRRWLEGLNDEDLGSRYRM